MTSRVGVSGQVRDGLSPSSTYKLSSAAFTKRNLTPAFTGWERGREGETEREREREREGEREEGEREREMNFV